MNENARLDAFAYLKGLRLARESLSQPKLDLELLQAQAASQDPSVASKARRLLRVHWDSLPEKSAEQAPTVSIIDQLSQFRDAERKIILEQMSAIQLTSGCNGECPFCLFGIKKGVSSKYSYASLETFFQEYGSELNKSLILYWDSDPFDYQDGDHSFVDVFKLWRNQFPEQSMYISTTIPKGGQEAFQDFLLYLIEQYYDSDTEKSKQYKNVTIRVSLGKHTLQRAEVVFTQLTERMIAKGYSKKQIEKFIKHIVSLESRFEDSSLVNLGNLISKHDDYASADTPACEDGIVLTPESIQAIFVVAPTVYMPSGQYSVEVTAQAILEQGLHIIPLQMYKGEYTHIYDGKLRKRISTNRILLPQPRTFENHWYRLHDAQETLFLRLGRYVFSLSSLLDNISYLLAVSNRETFSTFKRVEYLRKLSEAYRAERPYLCELITTAEMLAEKDAVSKETQEKLLYYISLTKAYVAKVDFIVEQIEQRKSSRLIIEYARVLTNVGRETISSLPEILGNIEDVEHHRTLAKRGRSGNDVALLSTSRVSESGVKREFARLGSSIEQLMFKLDKAFLGAQEALESQFKKVTADNDLITTKSID